jgi:hypothetical protein
VLHSKKRKEIKERLEELTISVDCSQWLTKLVIVYKKSKNCSLLASASAHF